LKQKTKEMAISESIVKDFVLIYHSENNMVPFTVGCFLESSKSTIFRARRCDYSKSFIDSYSMTQNGVQMSRIKGTTGVNNFTDCRL